MQKQTKINKLETELKTLKDEKLQFLSEEQLEMQTQLEDHILG